MHSSLEDNAEVGRKLSRVVFTCIETTNPRHSRHIIVPIVVLNLVLTPFYILLKIGQVPILKERARSSNLFHHRVRCGERRRK